MAIPRIITQLFFRRAVNQTLREYGYYGCDSYEIHILVSQVLRRLFVIDHKKNNGRILQTKLGFILKVCTYL